MADTFKIKAKSWAYKQVLLCLLYPASWCYDACEFFKNKAEQLREPAMEAYFATEKGAAVKIKLEEATKAFIEKLENHLAENEAHTKLPEIEG